MKKIILSTVFFSFLLFSCQTDLQEDAQLLEINSTVDLGFDGCETLYAKCFNTALCFLDSDELKGNNWGWTNGINLREGYVVYFPLYAGAAKCDPDKGTKVGDLKISYDIGTETLTVKYLMKEGYYLTETHFYIGKDRFPTDKDGNPSVSPGHYGNQHMLDKATNDEYIFYNIKPERYETIAHGVVCANTDDEYTSM